MKKKYNPAPWTPRTPIKPLHAPLTPGEIKPPYFSSPFVHKNHPKEPTVAVRAAAQTLTQPHLTIIQQYLDRIVTPHLWRFILLGRLLGKTGVLGSQMVEQAKIKRESWLRGWMLYCLRRCAILLVLRYSRSPR